MSDDPRAECSWRERALIAEALAEELLQNPLPCPRCAAAEADDDLDAAYPEQAFRPR